MNKQDMRNFGYLVSILTQHMYTKFEPWERTKLNHPVWYAEELRLCVQRLKRYDVNECNRKMLKTDETKRENTIHRATAICAELKIKADIGDGNGYIALFPAHSGNEFLVCE